MECGFDTYKNALIKNLLAPTQDSNREAGFKIISGDY